MTLDRRQALALMASGATAMLGPPALAAARTPRIDTVAEGVELNIPGDATPFDTAAAPRPGGGLLWSWVDRSRTGPRADGYLRAFDGDLAPTRGGRDHLFENRGSWSPDWTIALVSFADGSALFIYVAQRRSGPYRLLAVPIGRDGSLGAPTKLMEGQPEEIYAERLGDDQAIVVWRVQDEIFHARDIRWRVVAKDGSLPGDVRTLDWPEGIFEQTPLSVARLAGGGAALGYYRSSVSGPDKGRLFVQRIGRGGKVDGAPMSIGAEGGYLAVTGLRHGGFVSVRPSGGGELKLRFAKPGGGLHPEVAVGSGLDRITWKQDLRFGPQVAHAWYGGALILVGGVKGDRSQVRVLLVDELGRLLSAPAVIASAERRPGDGHRFRAMQAVTLVNGDVFLAWSFGDNVDPGPTRGAIVRIT